VPFRNPLSARVACSIAFLACCNPAMAEEGAGSRFQVGGLLFGDAYAIPSHHTGADWYGRARIEVNQDGEFETYTFDTRLKDLYLARKFGRQEFVLGLSSTLTYDLIESTWGARYLMRTPMDLQGVPSRDTGATLKGKLGNDKSFGYRVMYGSGLEYANQGGGGDKLMAALTWFPSTTLYVDLYTDYEKRPGLTDRSTWQLFMGRKNETLRWGLQYSHQDRQDDPTLELASAFLVTRLREDLSAIARIDRLLEPSPRGDGIAYIPFDPGARATMSLAGLEFRLASTFRITPNVIWTTYDRNSGGVRPDDDLHLRLTFFLDLE
jgi:hypothetical protein